MFKLNEKVIYPGHGLASIVKIVDRELSGKTFILKVISSGMEIMVPEKSVLVNSFRKLISVKEANEIHDFMENGTAKIDTSTWNKRYRIFLEDLKTGNAKDVANVVLSLQTLKKSKDLSFGERKMLDFASSLLNEELSEVLGVEQNFSFVM